MVMSEIEFWFDTAAFFDDAMARNNAIAGIIRHADASPHDISGAVRNNMVNSDSHHMWLKQHVHILFGAR